MKRSTNDANAAKTAMQSARRSDAELSPNFVGELMRWKVQWGSLTTIIGAALLVGVEVFGAAFAGGWAIGGVLRLGAALTYVLMALLGVAGVWLMGIFLQSAIKVEPIITWTDTAYRDRSSPTASK
jgi:hypothetical protein